MSRNPPCTSADAQEVRFRETGFSTNPPREFGGQATGLFPAATASSPFGRAARRTGSAPASLVIRAAAESHSSTFSVRSAIVPSRASSVSWQANSIGSEVGFPPSRFGSTRCSGRPLAAVQRFRRLREILELAFRQQQAAGQTLAWRRREASGQTARTDCRHSSWPSACRCRRGTDTPSCGMAME